MKKTICIKFYKNFDLMDYDSLLKKLAIKKDISFKKVIAFVIIWEGCFELFEKYSFINEITLEEEIIVYFITIKR